MSLLLIEQLELRRGYLKVYKRELAHSQSGSKKVNLPDAHVSPAIETNTTAVINKDKDVDAQAFLELLNCRLCIIKMLISLLRRVEPVDPLIGCAQSLTDQQTFETSSTAVALERICILHNPKHYHRVWTLVNKLMEDISVEPKAIESANMRLSLHAIAHRVLLCSPSQLLGDRYLVEKVIDEQSGVVLATDLRSMGKVVLKELEATFRGIQELVFTRLGRASSPVFIKVLDSFVVGESIYMVLERAEKSLLDLWKRWARSNATPVVQIDRIKSIIPEVANALASFHKAGYVHGDIKLDNIMLLNGAPRIIDLGLAFEPCRRPDGRIDCNYNCYTTGYTPPECMEPRRGKKRRNAGPHSDVFALGITIMRLAIPAAKEVLVTRNAIFYKRGFYKVKEQAEFIGKTISKSLGDLVQAMTEAIPSKRPTMAQVRDHPFFKGVVSATEVSLSSSVCGMPNTVNNGTASQECLGVCEACAAIALEVCQLSEHNCALARMGSLRALSDSYGPTMLDLVNHGRELYGVSFCDKRAETTEDVDQRRHRQPRYVGRARCSYLAHLEVTSLDIPTLDNAGRLYDFDA